MSVACGPKIVTSGLVMHLDAGNIKSYPGSGTAWTDLSGNGYVCTLSNASFNSANGGSIVYNNSSGDCGNILNPATGDFSISTWFKTTDTDGGIIVKKSASGAYYSFDLYGGGNGNCIFWFADSTRSGSEYVYGGYNAIDGNWHNVVGTLNRTTKSLLSYVDGAYYYVRNLTGITEDTITNTASLYIGTTTFTGNISIVQFYNRALTATEILQNYRANKGRFGL